MRYIILLLSLFLASCEIGYSHKDIKEAGDNGYDLGYAACANEEKSADIFRNHEIYEFDKDKARDQ